MVLQSKQKYWNIGPGEVSLKKTLDSSWRESPRYPLRESEMKARTWLCSSVLIAVLMTAGAGSDVFGADVTFNKDVMPILQANCQECHRPGEAVPMSLMSYESARPWAKSMKKMVEAREMPPWHADRSIGTWKNERGLTDEEIATISRWADAGAPRGDPNDLPPAREFAQGWKIGEPDMIFTMPTEQVLPPELEDEYRYVMIPTGLKEVRWVKAAEVRAGNLDVVHHVITFTSTMEAMMKGELTGGGDLGSSLGGTAPGMQPFVMEEGIGMRLPPNAVLILQVHYHKETGLEARDRTSIGIIFADYPVKKMMKIGQVGEENFVIPAGDPNYKINASITIPEDITMMNIMPHMHLRGTDMKVWAKYPDGTMEEILQVPKYDFNWQFFYDFSVPKKFPAGTQLFAEAHFDNSVDNLSNPDPTIDVRYGLPTTAEMMYAFYTYTTDDEDLNAMDPSIVAGGGGADGGE